MKWDKDILWSTFVQFAGKAAQMVLGIISIKLLTNALGPENYGTYGKISEFSLFFATTANLGIFGNTIRKMAENPKDGRLFANALFLRILTALFFFGAGVAYAFFFIKDALFLTGTLLFMASLLLDYLTSVCDGLLQVHYRMGRATLALISGRATALAIIYLLIQASELLGSFSTALFFLAPLSGAIITLTLTYFFAQQILKPKWALDQTLLKTLLWTSLPFGIINILNNLYFRFIPSTLLAVVLNEETYGTYNLSLHLASTVSLLSTLFMFSVLPKLEYSLKQKHFGESRALYKNARILLFIGALGVVGIGSWLAPLALTLVSSKEFLDTTYWFILPLLLILAAVSYFYDLAFLTLFALNKDVMWLKQEFKVLVLALGFFALAFYAGPTIPTKTALILTGAIGAEAAMALWGMRIAKKTLREN